MDVDALKSKVIEEYNALIRTMRKGYRLDYKFILDEISFINIINDLDNKLSSTALQYYLNNKWQIQL